MGDLDLYGPRTLRERLRRYLGDNPGRRRRSLSRALAPLQEKGWPVYVFGGVPRDLMAGPRARPRDFDLVVDGVEVDEIERAFADVDVVRNRFGGLRVQSEGWAVDVWPVARTWAFTERRLPSAKGLPDLPRTTFLNVEAVAVELWGRATHGREVYESGFFEGFRQRVVELNLADNPHPEFAILRAFLVARKLRFRLGPRLVEHIQNGSSPALVSTMNELLWTHYPTKAVPPATLSAWHRAVLAHETDAPLALPFVAQYEARPHQADLFEGQQLSLWETLKPMSSSEVAWIY